MGLRLDIKKTLSSRSDRVKCVDFHPTEPWLLVSLYNGQCHIWNFETQTLVKTFEVSELPARTGKFIARKNWFIVGSDDMHIRVFNYNTHEKVHAFEGHTDYIRCLAIHQSQPFVLSSADDMLIKLWDWDKNWRNVMTFEGHAHYVMSVMFNPKDSNTFASASLDKTIKVWNLGSSVPNYTLEGHEKGVNWLDYYHGGEKPYLVSAADDKTVKVWDYQNKSCIQTLTGHTQNVSVACFHPELPIIISGSEDGTIRLWHSNTYRLENTLNYGFERVWTVAYQRGSNSVAIGYDEGTIAIKLGREDPVVSMDVSGGKIIWAKHNEILMTHVQSSDMVNVRDGDVLALTHKDLGNCEVYPQTLQHSPNGRFAVVCGDGEFIIYTAVSWRNKAFGNALEFVWAQDSNEYAIRESSMKIKSFKAFKERHQLRISYSAESIYGGSLLGIRSGSFICFYDWNTAAMVRRIDVIPTNIYWSDNGDLVCIACQDHFFILKYHAGAVDDYLGSGKPIPDEGIEEAFEVVYDLQDSVKNGCWIGDCFIFGSNSNRLNYLIGGQIHTIAHFDSSMFLLGYLPKESRVYVCDKDVNIYGYMLPLHVLEYQTAILRGDFEAAKVLVPNLTNDQRNKISRFLEGLDHKEMALEMAVDPDQRFDLAIQLKKLDIAHKIAKESDNESRWNQLGDLALAEWKVPMAADCMKNAKDHAGLLLLYHCMGDAAAMQSLASECATQGDLNLAFNAYFLLGKPFECLQILLNSNRFAEAALFARSYLPSQMSRIVTLWREMLQKSGFKKSAEAIADPVEYENLFPDLKYALLAEMKVSESGSPFPLSSSLNEWKKYFSADPLEVVKSEYPDASKLPSVSQLISQATEQGRRQSPGQPEVQLTSTALLPSPDQPTAPFSARSTNTASGKSQLAAQGLSHSRLDGMDDADAISDNMSHLSMEVNTTGTGSIKGDQLELLDMDSASELSFTSTENLSTFRAPAAASVPPMLMNATVSPTSANMTSSRPTHVSSAYAPQLNREQSQRISPTVSRPNPHQFNLNELDAALATAELQLNSGSSRLSGSGLTGTAGAARNPASLTGDPELDEFLNL